MSNGNGVIDNPLYDSAPVSKYIRPVSAIMGMVVGFVVLLVTVMYIMWCGLNKADLNLGIVLALGAVTGVCFGFTLWYFNVRGQDKLVSNFADTLKGIVNSPKANGQMAVPAATVNIPAGPVSPIGETTEVTSVTETVKNKARYESEPYYEPPDPDEWVTTEMTSYEKYDETDDRYGYIDLTNFKPEVRIPWATLVVRTALGYLAEAWSTITGLPNFAFPAKEMFADWVSIQTFKKSLMDAIPGCAWLSEAQELAISDIGKTYTLLGKLENIKNVQWYKDVKYISTIEDIRQLG